MSQCGRMWECGRIGGMGADSRNVGRTECESLSFGACLCVQHVECYFLWRCNCKFTVFDNDNKPWTIGSEESLHAKPTKDKPKQSRNGEIDKAEVVMQHVYTAKEFSVQSRSATLSGETRAAVVWFRESRVMELWKFWGVATWQKTVVWNHKEPD